MIVIAIIAIIAAIAIPNLLAAKLNANETSAMATLRNLVSCQAQISVSGKIDCDRDGKGEYGTFMELSGAVGVRKGYDPTPPGASDFSVKGEVVTPSVLSPVFSRVDGNGFATKSGYVLVIYLPDAAAGVAGFVHEAGPASGPSFAGGTGTVGVNLAETVWCSYAQPMLLGGSGRRRFFTNQKGDIMQTQNDVAKGQGNLTPIQPDSAFLGAGITSALAMGTAGNDGDRWLVVN